MAEVLDRVAEAVRARAELSRELRTLTAQSRGSRWIVTLIPPGLLLVIDLLNPTYLKPLFNTTTGQVLIGLAVVLICAGSVVMREVKRIFELPEVQKTLTEVGAVPSPLTPEAYTAFIAGERRKWQEVVQAAGVTVQ